MEISLFSTLIGKLYLVVQRAFFAAHLLRLPQHPLDFKGQLRWGAELELMAGFNFFFGTLCALFTRSQLGTYTENQEESREVWTMCEAHLLFIFISLNLWLPSAWTKRTSYGIGIFFPKEIPIQFDLLQVTLPENWPFHPFHPLVQDCSSQT